MTPLAAPARFVAVHREAHTSLATQQLCLAADELSACESAVGLLGRLEQLSTEREAALAEARSAAAAEGHAAGRAAALRDTAPQLLQAWQAAADAAKADADALRAAVVELSLQVVQRITAELAPADVVAALARRAAQALVPDQPAVLRVHPAVAEAVARQFPLPRLEVRADAALAPLDCVFDTPAGELLAGLDGQLARVGEALRAAAPRA